MIPGRPDLHPPTVPQSGPSPWRIVDTVTRACLESWPTEYQAEYFCRAVNDHEARNGRATRYTVERRAR